VGLLSFFHRHKDIAELRPRLYRLAYAWCHDTDIADDLVQDTLARAMLHRAQLQDEQALLGWMIAILKNVWYDHLRRNRVHENIDDWAEVIYCPGEAPDEACGKGQLIDCLRWAVSCLPMGQRQVLTLVELEEMSYADTARALDIPVGTVMSRLARARGALKIIMTSRQVKRVTPHLRRVV
jgi:RNA polymerase sigma-70 factor (ECF subfamily)